MSQPAPPPSRSYTPDPLFGAASEPALPSKNWGHSVTVTAYTSDASQTDEDPTITATGTIAGPGTIALSRDLLAEYTPGAPFRYGDRVRLIGYGEFVVQDTMHPRWNRRADLWLPTSESARHFGRRRAHLSLIRPALELASGDFPRSPEESPAPALRP